MPTASTIQKLTLRLGSQGPEVKELQRLLNQAHYGLVVDGIFGAHTEYSVKRFQVTVFLENDGVVGNKTWQALYTGAPVDMPVLRLGSRQGEVKTVQTLLELLAINFGNTSYDPGPIDSFYGEKTERAVVTFQWNSGLPADGVVGPRTWHALSKHGYLLNAEFYC